MKSPTTPYARHFLTSGMLTEHAQEERRVSTSPGDRHQLTSELPWRPGMTQYPAASCLESGETGARPYS